MFKNNRSLVIGVIVFIIVNIVWWAFDLPNPRMDIIYWMTKR